jgi:hypothetical protein
MPNFNKRKLQVFVSSTYTDLIEERQAAVEAILTAGHIPAGMELFTAGDESQLEVINQWIDESDVYLLILGGRYGSIEPKTGKSYTHLEYEYALNKNKPLFSCVINENALENRVKTGKGTSIAIETKETKNPQKLEEFRKLVMSKMVKFWDDTKDIKLTVYETLFSFERGDGLVGWVRADQNPNMPEFTNEITRLSKENSDLRKENEEYSLSIKSLKEKLLPAIQDIAEMDENIKLYGTWTDINKNQRLWEVITTWNEIFNYIAPYFSRKWMEEYLAKDKIEHFVVEQLNISVSSLVLDEQLFQTIKFQLIAYGLITTSSEYNNNDDVACFWYITEKGKAKMMELRVVRTQKRNS